MDYWIEEIKEIYTKNSDFFFQKDFLLGQPVYLFGFQTLLDLPRTKKLLAQTVNIPASEEGTINEVHSLDSYVLGNDKSQIIQAINDGKLILYFTTDKNFFIVEPIPHSLSRAISEPSNENVVHGPHDSFIEDIDTNIGLLRKQVNSKNLKARNFIMGTDCKKKVTVLYVEHRVDQKLLKATMNHLEINQTLEVTDGQSIIKALGYSGWALMAKCKVTEMPLETMHSLKKGRVVIMIDGISSALIIPNTLWDLFILETDRNFSAPLMIFIRSIRVIGVLTAIFLPGLYVAFVSVNPEVLRIELALSIAQSREGVPYPALVEVLLMLILLELILEASIRLPKSIGPTVTMVGGIILGQAVISAKLVSNLLTIVVAATTIANSTVVGVQNYFTIRLFKYLNVILAAIFGVIGVLIGAVIICSYLACVDIYGVPFVDLPKTKGESKNG